MYGYVWVCMSMYEYIYMYVCLYVCMHACMHVCMSINLYINFPHTCDRMFCADNDDRDRSTMISSLSSTSEALLRIVSMMMMLLLLWRNSPRFTSLNCNKNHRRFLLLYFWKRWNNTLWSDETWRKTFNTTNNTTSIQNNTKYIGVLWCYVWVLVTYSIN